MEIVEEAMNSAGILIGNWPLLKELGLLLIVSYSTI